MSVTKSAINAALSIIAGPGMANQLRRDIVTLSLLGVKPGIGANCTWNVKAAARTTAAPHAEGADFSSFSTDTRLQATLNWAEYAETAKLSGLSEAVAIAGGYAGGNLLMEELKDAVDSLAVKLGQHTYAGNHAASPTELAGAALAIDESDDNFAGIDTGDNTWWAAGEDTGGLTTFALSDLRTKLHRPVKDATGRNPGFVTTTGAIMDALQTRFDEAALTRHVQKISVNGVVIDTLATFGQEAVMLDGVPYLEDRHCTANTLYAWTPEYVEVRQLTRPVDPKTNVTEIAEAMKALTGVEIPMDQLAARIRSMNASNALMPRIDALARTGDARKFAVTVKAQLAWLRRNAFAKLTLS